MTYKEEIRDLFSVPEDYTLVHCISSDFALGAGIAVRFKQMGVKDELCSVYKINDWRGCGYLLPTSAGRKTFNLVTKEKCWHKPTYTSLKQALEVIKKMPERKIAMPLIGCGLDGLEWEKVSAMIQRVFADTNIEILVCRLK